MKNLQIGFSWQFMVMFMFFSPGKARKTCKPGQVNNASQHFYMTARGKFETFK